MSDVTDLSWVEVLSRGLSRKAINAQSQRAKDLTAKGLTRKATAILQQALTPGPVLSTFPNKTFGHRTVAYRVIQEQFSVNVQFRPLSLYHQKPNGGFLAEAKFDKIEDTKRAIHTGIIYKEVVYKTTAVKDSSEGKLTHTQMIMIRIPNMHTFLEDLLRSLKYSGKVYQANKYKGRSPAIEPLVFLSSWDVYVPATYRGAPPACRFCRQSSHIKAARPILAKRKCFECHKLGHTARFGRKNE
ncbi:hypothetical protein HMPREF1544_06686 [Mucor circinelloides 1006PhL]|uniref:Uncharacterized protein n=1 Tax=Mucor circinelloides f. circinelloides (strain 1006PhL) TaxID=1220926 RepID=S2JA28_MUCC1|nr:hypothetical protein HMPREF1544_06686 [Mucor circinelloides 1006PhL]